MPRLLIIKPSSLGDIVHGLQFVASLQAQQPGWRVDWVAREIFAPLVQRARGIDRVHVFARRGGLRAFFQLLRQLRSTRYDAVFDLQGLFRSGLMTAAACAPRKVGRSDAREGARLFYGETVPLPPGGARSHALEILLQFAPVLGAETELRGQVAFTSDHRATFASLATLRQRPVLIFPESRRPEKNWPAFLELTTVWLADPARPPVVWAGSEPVVADSGWPAERFVNLTGQTKLEELPELLQRGRLVVGNDSGPLHLAAALGVPVLALFGPTDPRQYGPYPPGTPGRAVLRAPGGDLTQLSVHAVSEALVDALAETGEDR